MTSPTEPCPDCGGKGLVARGPGMTMDNQPVGEVTIARSEHFSALCRRCQGSGAIEKTVFTE